MAAAAAPAAPPTMPRAQRAVARAPPPDAPCGRRGRNFGARSALSAGPPRGRPTSWPLLQLSFLPEILTECLDPRVCVFSEHPTCFSWRHSISNSLWKRKVDQSHSNYWELSLRMH